MNHFFVAAAATAMLIGAGAGGVAVLQRPPPQPESDAMNPMIAGEAMPATRNLADSLAHSPKHTVFSRDLRKAGIAALLGKEGPFTVFAPVDSAFAAAATLPDGAALVRLLDYHIVRGRLDSKSLLRLISNGGGVAKLKTLEGGTLTAMLNGPTNIALIDGHGSIADIMIYDIYQSNGVMQVIDRVLFPDRSRLAAR